MWILWRSVGIARLRLPPSSATHAISLGTVMLIVAALSIWAASGAAKASAKAPTSTV